MWRGKGARAAELFTCSNNKVLYLLYYLLVSTSYFHLISLLLARMRRRERGGERFLLHNKFPIFVLAYTNRSSVICNDSNRRWVQENRDEKHQNENVRFISFYSPFTWPLWTLQRSIYVALSHSSFRICYQQPATCDCGWFTLSVLCRQWAVGSGGCWCCSLSFYRFHYYIVGHWCVTILGLALVLPMLLLLLL